MLARSKRNNIKNRHRRQIVQLCRSRQIPLPRALQSPNYASKTSQLQKTSARWRWRWSWGCVWKRGQGRSRLWRGFSQVCTCLAQMDWYKRSKCYNYDVISERSWKKQKSFRSSEKGQWVWGITDHTYDSLEPHLLWCVNPLIIQCCRTGIWEEIYRGREVSGEYRSDYHWNINQLWCGLTLCVLFLAVAGSFQAEDRRAGRHEGCRSFTDQKVTSKAVYFSLLNWGCCHSPLLVQRMRCYSDWQAHSQLRQTKVMTRHTCEWWCHCDVMVLWHVDWFVLGYSTLSRRCWKEKGWRKTKKIFLRKEIILSLFIFHLSLSLSFSFQIRSQDQIAVQGAWAISSRGEKENWGNALQPDALWYSWSGPWTRVMIIVAKYSGVI